MLEPHSRTLLLDALRPPDGFHLDFAAGTTYTLDLLALLTAPVAMAFSDCEDNDGKPVMDPLVLLKAIRENAGKIAVFHHAGRISVPKTFSTALGVYLEETVVSVLPKNGGRFHPKVWALRFTDGDAVKYRLLVMSRNLTFDRAWDTMLVLEGESIERQNAFAVNHPLADFFESLPRKLAAPWPKRLDTLAYELRRVAFEVPEPFAEISFHPFGLESSTDPIPDGLSRLLVVSPFVDDKALQDLLGRAAAVSVIGRSECLDTLKADTLKAFENVWTIDDGAEVEDEETLAGLHAKLYVAEQGWYATVFTGSANATAAGFGRNVEFLVGMTGKKSQVGIEAMIGEGAAGKPNLRGLLVPYTPSNVPPDNSVKQFEALRDKLADAVAATLPHAECEPLPDDVYRVRLKQTRGKPVTIPAACMLRVESLAAPGVSQVVDAGGEPFAEFTLSLDSVSAFFVFELTDAEKGLTRRFVLNVPLLNPPAHRKERTLQKLLGDPAKVMKFLLMLLADESAQAAALALNDLGKTDPGDGVTSIGQATMFESLLHAMARRPEQVDRVLASVADLQKVSPQSVPADFDALLQPFRELRPTQGTP